MRKLKNEKRKEKTKKKKEKEKRNTEPGNRYRASATQEFGNGSATGYDQELYDDDSVRTSCLILSRPKLIDT